MHPYSSHLISLQSRNINVNVFTAYKSTEYVLQTALCFPCTSYCYTKHVMLLSQEIYF